jgi:tRNA A-37 threonylcarbamoyl transferase component Bud32
MSDNLKIKVLESYRDRAFITSLLCGECSDFYSMIRSVINIPLIIGSSVLTILNSSDINKDDLKISNIIINASTAIMLSMTSNFKLTERIANFKQTQIKMNRLTHSIESTINNTDEINNENINKYINDYDTIFENIEYPFVHYIKKRIIKKYGATRTLPNSLQLDAVFVVDVCPHKALEVV